jgi:hypothetical protein
MFRRFFFVQNRSTVSARRHMGLHFLTTGWAIAHAHRHVRPLAFHAQSDRLPPVRVGNLAKGVPSRKRLLFAAFLIAAAISVIGYPLWLALGGR